VTMPRHLARAASQRFEEHIRPGPTVPVPVGVPEIPVIEKSERSLQGLVALDGAERRRRRGGPLPLRLGGHGDSGHGSGRVGSPWEALPAQGGG